MPRSAGKLSRTLSRGATFANYAVFPAVPRVCESASRCCGWRYAIFCRAATEKEINDVYASTESAAMAMARTTVLIAVHILTARRDLIGNKKREEKKKKS